MKGIKYLMRLKKIRKIVRWVIKYCNYTEIGTYIEDSSKQEYINYILSTYNNKLSSINYKIAVDVANGAAGAIIDDVLEDLD